MGGGGGEGLRYFGLGLVGGALVAAGGYAGREGGILHTVEECGEEEMWRLRSRGLHQARASCGAVVVPSSVCG